MASGFRVRLLEMASVGAFALASQANGQVAKADTPPAETPPTDGDQNQPDIVVTGFRSSLSAALAQKRNDIGVVDSIVAEDIAKFPDKNLGESLQRVPGVALSRGDGAEGKQVTVRGLGAGFTRVRINGIEALSTAGGSDIQGSGNRGRGFDFNVFAAELFTNLTVRKTASPDVEEGSLGATIDLTTAKPLDYKKDFVLAASMQGTYNELNGKVDPRATLLVSRNFANGTFGVLGSIAYARRHTREEGAGMVNALPSTVDGGFCSPTGFAPQNPVNNAQKGTDALNCAGGVPRTSNPAAYALINNAGVIHPRQARFLRSDQEYERLGATVSLQWAPSDDTKVSLDGLYARFDVKRTDDFLTPISFGRSLTNNGKPHTSVLEAEVDDNGSFEYGRFNGVDLRSESIREEYVTTFKQGTLRAYQRLSDQVELDLTGGYSRSDFDDPNKTTIFIDAVNTNGFSFDYRGGRRIPAINYGIDVTDAANFAFAPMRPDGTVLGGVGLREYFSRNEYGTGEANLIWTVNDDFKIRVGGQYRISDFRSRERGRSTLFSNTTPALPAGTTLSSLTRQVDDFGKGLPDGAPSGWVAADYDKFNELLDISSYSGAFALVGVGPNSQALGGNTRVRERISVAYGQAEFKTDEFQLPIRGVFGLRYARTDQLAVGYVSNPAVAAGNTEVVVERTYDDFLPSLNLTAEFSSNLLLRLGAARVISRADLGSLSPGGSVNVTTRNYSTGNPFLEPIRADTLDLSGEYYIGNGGLFSVGLFYKKLQSFVQRRNEIIPFTSTGLPVSILQGSTTSPDELFTVSRFVNAPGGTLRGVEVNYQQPFTFLPGALRNFGTILNYTFVRSRISYVVTQSPLTLINTDLSGLSRHGANGTLYYEDKRFSIRGSAAYRGSFLTAIPSGGTGSDVEGRRSTLFVDASASYALTDRIKITAEGINLTDESTSFYIDSRRQDPLYESHVGRTFTLGASFTF